MSNRASLGDYYRTGQQDCANVISIDEFDVRTGMQKGWTAYDIVDARLSADDWQDRASWLDQQDERARAALGDDAMWDAWRNGWRDVAIGIIKAEIEDRTRDLDGDE